MKSKWDKILDKCDWFIMTTVKPLYFILFAIAFMLIGGMWMTLWIGYNPDGCGGKLIQLLWEAK